MVLFMIWYERNTYLSKAPTSWKTNLVSDFLLLGGGDRNLRNVGVLLEETEGVSENGVRFLSEIIVGGVELRTLW